MASDTVHGYRLRGINQDKGCFHVNDDNLYLLQLNVKQQCTVHAMFTSIDVYSTGASLFQLSVANEKQVRPGSDTCGVFTFFCCLFCSSRMFRRYPFEAKAGLASTVCCL